MELVDTFGLSPNAEKHGSSNLSSPTIINMKGNLMTEFVIGKEYKHKNTSLLYKCVYICDDGGVLFISNNGTSHFYYSSVLDNMKEYIVPKSIEFYSYVYQRSDGTLQASMCFHKTKVPSNALRTWAHKYTDKQ